MRAPRLPFDGPPGLRRWLFGHTRPRPALACLLALCACVLALLANAWTAWQLRSAVMQTRTSLAAPSPGVRRAAAPAGKPAELAAWTEAVQHMNTPWSAVFDSLEQLATPDVTLLGIAPEGRSTRLRLQAESRTLPALLAYADRLRQAPGFADVVLLRHDTQEQDTARPVRLSLDIDPGLLPAGSPAPAEPSQ